MQWFKKPRQYIPVHHATRRKSIPDGLWKKCVRCQEILYIPELERRMDELRVTIFYPYPGTALYGESRRCDMLTGKNVVHYADDTTLKLKTISPAQIRFVARYFRILVVVYQKLLRNGGNPAGLIGRLLDRFLLSKPAEKAIFPVANGIYPLVVKAVRWLRLYDKPGAA